MFLLAKSTSWESFSHSCLFIKWADDCGHSQTGHFFSPPEFPIAACKTINFISITLLRMLFYQQQKIQLIDRHYVVFLQKKKLLTIVTLLVHILKFIFSKQMILFFFPYCQRKMKNWSLSEINWCSEQMKSYVNWMVSTITKPIPIMNYNLWICNICIKFIGTYIWNIMLHNIVTSKTRKWNNLWDWILIHIIAYIFVTRAKNSFFLNRDIKYSIVPLMFVINVK